MLSRVCCLAWCLSGLLIGTSQITAAEGLTEMSGAVWRSANISVLGQVGRELFKEEGQVLGMSGESIGPFLPSRSSELLDGGEATSNLLRQGASLFGADFRSQFGGFGGGGTGVPMRGGGGVLPVFVPMISVIQQYDSNVFSVAKIPGLVRDDFVTTILPTLNIIPPKSGLVTGSVAVGAIGEVYAKHPELNYVGANAGGYLDVSRLVQLIVPRLTLQVSDRFQYTPQPPAFLSGSSNASVADEPNQFDTIANSYGRGLQTQRVNQYSNSVSITSTYAVTPRMSMFGAANHAIQRFGSTPGVSQQFTLVSSDTRSIFVGPQYTFSGGDVIRLVASHSRTNFSGDQSSEFPAYFETNGVQGMWKRFLGTPSVVGSVTFGVNEVLPGHQFQYIGSAGVTWMNFPNVFAATFTRDVAPGYIGVGGATTSDLVTVSATRRLDQFLSVTGSLNYARAESIESALGPNNNRSFSFQSYMAATSLSYKLSPSLTMTASYSYSLFESFGLSSSGGISGGQTTFDKHLVMIQFQKGWY